MKRKGWSLPSQRNLLCLAKLSLWKITCSCSAEISLISTAKISQDLVLTEYAPASVSSRCCPGCLCIVPPGWQSVPQPLSSEVWQDCVWATPCGGWACFSPWLQVLRSTFPLIALPGCSWSQHWEQGLGFMWSQHLKHPCSQLSRGSDCLLALVCVLCHKLLDPSFFPLYARLIVAAPHSHYQICTSAYQPHC